MSRTRIRCWRPFPVRAQHTDGLDVTSRAMAPRFPAGTLAMKSNRGAFHFYTWEDVQARIAAVISGRG